MRFELVARLRGEAVEVVPQFGAQSRNWHGYYSGLMLDPDVVVLEMFGTHHVTSLIAVTRGKLAVFYVCIRSGAFDSLTRRFLLLNSTRNILRVVIFAVSAVLPFCISPTFIFTNVKTSYR